MQIDVYADGSASTSDKPGGYGFVIVVDDEKKSEGSGHMLSATNNDAELEAAIQGLASLLKMIVKNPEEFPNYEATLVSDSRIVLGWANGTYRCKQESKKKKLEQLKFLVKRLKVKTRWVRGHSGDKHNTRCDQLANAARRLKPLVKEEKPKKEKVKNTIGRKTDNVFNIWFGGVLKIIDLQNNICEDHDVKVHGPRNSRMEYRNK